MAARLIWQAPATAALRRTRGYAVALPDQLFCLVPHRGMACVFELRLRVARRIGSPAMDGIGHRCTDFGAAQ